MKRRILCVDDNVALCDTLAAMLTSALGNNADVSCAYNGGEAIAALLAAKKRSEKFDLILLDMMVPPDEFSADDIKFGLKLLTSIQERFQLIDPSTVVVVYTHFDHDRPLREVLENCVECVQAGATDYIIKESPDAGFDSVDYVVERCVKCIANASNQNPDQELLEWIKQHEELLVDKFGGKVIGRVTNTAAVTADLNGTSIGGFTVVCGDNYSQVRDMLAADMGLLTSCPDIVNIPKEREIVE